MLLLLLLPLLLLSRQLWGHDPTVRKILAHEARVCYLCINNPAGQLLDDALDWTEMINNTTPSHFAVLNWKQPCHVNWELIHLVL